VNRPLRRRSDAAEFVGSVIDGGNLLMTRQKAQLDIQPKLVTPEGI
jgi:hypothetical protein